MNELTDEWIELYEEDLARGYNLADSFWYRMALECLPLGVNPHDPRVVAALDNIRRQREERDRKLSGS